MSNAFSLPICGRRELRKQDRRVAILEAARQSFLENGYAGTSMSGLLKTLGGSKATLWSYFRSKEELFAATIEHASAAFRAQFDQSLTLADDLEPTLAEFCRRFLAAIQSPDAVATWRLVIAESGRFPELGRIFYDRAARVTEKLLSDFLAHHIAAGHLVLGDPVEMTRMIISLCAGRQTRLLWGIEQVDADAIERDSVEFARLFVRAYGKP